MEEKLKRFWALKLTEVTNMTLRLKSLDTPDIEKKSINKTFKVIFLLLLPVLQNILFFQGVLEYVNRRILFNFNFKYFILFWEFKTSFNNNEL